MKTLPNGLTIFNATPHAIRFWDPSWLEPIEVEPDEVINAAPVERPGDSPPKARKLAEFVRTVFVGSPKGREVLSHARLWADVVVGSIIAAQAYPGEVVAMVPCEGYERVPPDQKRMRPDKFTVY